MQCRLTSFNSMIVSNNSCANSWITSSKVLQIQQMSTVRKSKPILHPTIISADLSCRIWSLVGHPAYNFRNLQILIWINIIYKFTVLYSKDYPSCNSMKTHTKLFNNPVKKKTQIRIIPVTDRSQAEGLAGCGHSKIARVRAYYLYCMCLAPAD